MHSDSPMDQDLPAPPPGAVTCSSSGSSPAGAANSRSRMPPARVAPSGIATSALPPAAAGRKPAPASELSRKRRWRITWTGGVGAGKVQEASYIGGGLEW